MQTIVSRPVTQGLRGTLRVPGDKSISHRALMFGGVADGRTEITGLLEGEDCLATAAAMRALGVSVQRVAEGQWVVDGVGLRGLKPAAGPLDMGNSGTGMRLLTGLLAGQTFASTLVGDASLSTRPMRRIMTPLSQMGARIESNEGCAPLKVSASGVLNGIDYAMPVASAQVKSAILLAGLYAQSPTIVREPGPSRDHTERLLSAMGAPVERLPGGVQIGPCDRLTAVNIDLPSYLSSAAFFLVAANLVPGSNLVLPAVGTNPTRRGVLDILEIMGAALACRNDRQVGGEPITDVTCTSSALRSAEIGGDLVPLAIDEFPVLFIAAANASGVSRFDGLAELRHKESDRIGVMVQGLRSLGISVEEGEDWVSITGGTLSPGTVDSHGDHRIAMAFAVAGTVASGPIVIQNSDQIATSFPGFVDLANAVGMKIEILP